MRRASHEAALYNRGFRDAQRAYAASPLAAPASPPPAFGSASDDLRPWENADGGSAAAPAEGTREHTEEEARAQASIGRFLSRHDGGGPAPEQPSLASLSRERQDIDGSRGVAGAGPPASVLAPERAQASQAIARFFGERDGGAKDTTVNYSTRALVGERKRIARMLGVRSLTHGAPAAEAVRPMVGEGAIGGGVVTVDGEGRAEGGEGGGGAGWGLRGEVDAQAALIRYCSHPS